MQALYAGAVPNQTARRGRVCCAAAWAALALIAARPGAAEVGPFDDRSTYRAPRAAVAPVIDGAADDPAWQDAEWRAIDQRWLGPEFAASDFSGRFKVVWTADRLYLLAEIVDDILYDAHRDPLVQYWDDDCLEIYVDEDRSGGDHQYNYSAFAYHVSLDNRTIDMGTDGKAHDYSHHAESRWLQNAEALVWEVAIDVYGADYADDSGDNQPVTLYPGKVLGLMVAYNDNDASQLRENFIGSESIPTGPKDRGWIDASVFGTLVLTESE